MKKLASIAIVMVLLSSTLFAALPVAFSAPLPDYVPVDWQSGLAGEVPMPEIGPLEEGIELSEIVDVESFHSTPPVGTWVWDWYLYARAGGTGYGTPYMCLRAVVGNAEVWVAEDASLMYPTGDPRNANPENWNVTDEMAQYIAEEFANNIYPTDAFYFGPPADRDGTGTIFEAIGYPSWTYDWIETYPYNPQRVIIKIFNIEDDSYWDPTYPYYVVGFYSSTYTGYYNRNMIHIDNWKYCERLGPEGTEWIPGIEVIRPYVYEATVAHEFQHNIHRDWQPSPETWMNEGCSMYAELVCGYGIEVGYFNAYFATPDNSLTIWGDQGDMNIIADYGVAALWTAYLSDHYGGGDTIRTYVQSGITGIEGIDYALDAMGYPDSFFDVYRDWRIANLLRKHCGPYGYKSIDLNDPEVEPVRMYTVSGWTDWISASEEFGNTMVPLDPDPPYDTGISMVGAYGSDYIMLEDWPRSGILKFDGDDIVTEQEWIWTGTEWYSGTGDEINLLIAAAAHVDGADPTLTITTYVDIEDYWDFGFVQVSTDGGMTWTSLENEYTTYDHDPSAMLSIVDNLPGLTGWSGDYIDMTFDLTDYADQDIMIGFRYMTDWAFTYEGWYISAAAVSGTSILEQLGPLRLEADFLVTVIHVYEFCGKTFYFPMDMHLKDATETGWWLRFGRHIDTILIVSPTIPKGVADYQIKTSELFCGCHWW